jgi:hypothetical protein
VNHGLGTKTLGVSGADADGGTAFGGDGSGEAFVEQSGENHYGDISSFAIGDAESRNEITFDTHAVEGGGEKAATTMDDEDLVTFASEDSDLTRDVAYGGGVFEQGSGKFDDSSHVSAVCSLMCSM